jgi:hypothetical protein
MLHSSGYCLCNNNLLAGAHSQSNTMCAKTSCIFAIHLSTAWLIILQP